MRILNALANAIDAAEALDRLAIGRLGDGMVIYIIGLLIFFAIHSERMVAPGFRDRIIAARGEGTWKGVYSLISLLGFVLIVWGWMSYRPQAPQIYVPPEWGRHFAMLLVLLGFICVEAAYVPPNHIKAYLRHPFLTGIFLWALAHLFANGDLAGIILFGAFLVYAVVDRIAVTTRPQPVVAEPTLRGDLIAIIVGAALYAVFLFWLHGLLFGVSPLG